MTRQFLLAICLVASAVFINAPTATAASSTLQCEDRHVNCLGRCADWTGGAGDYAGRQNRCLPVCDRRLTQCFARDALRRRW